MEEQSATTPGKLIRELSVPLQQAGGWMKLTGVLLIIDGVLIALSIVGILVAWIPIWLGVLLFQSASAAGESQVTEDKEPLLRSLNKLKLFFTINGILLLVMLILGILSFLFGGFSMMGMYMHGGGTLHGGGMWQ